MSSNAKRYAEAIARARTGDTSAEQFLRQRLKSTADVMPLDVLVAVSETLLDGRRDELRRDAERN